MLRLYPLPYNDIVLRKRIYMFLFNSFTAIYKPFHAPNEVLKVLGFVLTHLTAMTLDCGRDNIMIIIK